jgi:hypothetical protein
VIEAVSGCFRENTEPTSNVKVSVRTSVTLEVTPEGTISTVNFEPPLSPSMQVCSEERIQSVRFASSAEGASVTRLLELSR